MTAIFSLLAVIAVVPAALAGWSLWTAWRNPRKILELHEEIRREDEPPGVRRPLLQHRLIVAMSFLGYGIFIYGGVSTALFWMPLEWGQHDEDGGWSPYKTTIAVMFAGIGAVGFTYMVLDYCRLKLKEQWRREDGQ